MAPRTITGAIFDAVADHSQPLLTFYDDGSGERTELSGATLGNWAAKTANYLRDEVGVEPDDEVIVDLPTHWQTASILLGAWWAGAHVRTTDDAVHPRAAFVRIDDVDRYDADEIIVASLDPFALPIADLPIGVADFGSAVRVHGDQYTDVGVIPRLALDSSTVTDVVEAARGQAASDGIVAGTRVLTGRPFDDAAGIVANLLPALVSGASLVVVRGYAGDLSARATSERASVVLT